MSKEKVKRIADIRGEIWRLLDINNPDKLQVHRLQNEANGLALQLAGASSENLGDCAVCKKRLTWDTVDKDAVGIIRLASNYKLWCECCTDLIQ